MKKKPNIKLKTLKVRVKDRHAAELLRMAKSVNFVWNYINDLSYRTLRERNKWMSDFDMAIYTKGAAKELGIHSQTTQMVAKEYVTRRKQFKKAKLRWRVSNGKRRSLGWIPINTDAAKFKNGEIYHNRKTYKIWDSFNLEQYEFKTASFNEDARGRWYFNVVVVANDAKTDATASVGIDLGCKDAVTTSNGDVVTGRWYRELQAKLGLAQRAKKQHLIRNIHAKIKNRRKDELHKFSRKLVDENAAIFVGNVSSNGLSKTKMAKSVLDAGWGMFKTMLEYKCDHAGVIYEVVNEAYTTQTCSCCGVIPTSSPKGRTGLGIREWECSDCGAVHDRDVNAAKNILVVGHGHLAGGIPAL